VSFAKACRNDDIKRLSNSVKFGKSEKALGAMIPITDQAFGVCINDGIGSVGNKCLTELGDIDVHNLISGGGY